MEADNTVPAAVGGETGGGRGMSAANVRLMPVAPARGRRRAVAAVPPIAYKTIAYGSRLYGGGGVAVEAEGTVEQLIAAGVCTRGHLPSGRSRKRYCRSHSIPPEHAVSAWQVERLRGGRLKVRAELRDAKELHLRISRAMDRLRYETDPNLLECLRAAALDRIGGTFGIVDRVSCLRDLDNDNGIAVDEFSAAQLNAICDQIEALAERAARLVGSARFVVDDNKRKVRLANLQDQCSVPMPALPDAMPVEWHVIERQRQGGAV